MNFTIQRLFLPLWLTHNCIAETFINKEKLDKLLIIPAEQIFYKNVSYVAEYKDRMNMCKIAFQNNSKVEISDMESCKSGNRYTYDTLCKISKLYPEARLFLLVGSDVLSHIFKWYKAEEFLRMVTLCSFIRPGSRILTSYMNIQEIKEKTKEFHLYGDNMPNISSTMIRNYMKEGKDISKLVDSSVEKYIHENNIYNFKEC